MDDHEFALIEALMERNDDIGMIAVGDDDQNIISSEVQTQNIFLFFDSKISCCTV